MFQSVLNVFCGVQSLFYFFMMSIYGQVWENSRAGDVVHHTIFLEWMMDKFLNLLRMGLTKNPYKLPGFLFGRISKLGDPSNPQPRSLFCRKPTDLRGLKGTSPWTNKPVAPDHLLAHPFSMTYLGPML